MQSRRGSDFMCAVVAALSLAALLGCDGGGGAGADAVPDAALTVEVVHDPAPINEAAAQVVEAAPAWLREDLEVNLARLDGAVQDELASLVAGLPDSRLLDEVLFTIAHLSPEVLADEDFYPELLQINAQVIYEAGPQIPYAELVEGDDGDGPYTTVRYTVEAAGGGTAETTLDRDVYYWNIVHPRLEDELPYFINPWASDNATTPEDGLFWRDFLWSKANDDCPAGRECPILAGWMDGVEVAGRLAEESAYETDGIARVHAFVHTAISWGAGAERPIQPCRIYAVGCGNCGEYADLTVSVARTALIPSQNVGAYAVDHTWAEMYMDGWIADPGEVSRYSNGVRRDLKDSDCDGLADDGYDTEDHDGDGVSVEAGDCDDNDDAVYPGADEVQNGGDDDCDGVADNGFTDAEWDADGDGFTIADGDCDDGSLLIFPGAVDFVNGRDDDCDGTADDGVDEGDADEDGHTIAAGDCDDYDAAIFPGAEEVSNGRDDNCDGVADEGFSHHDRDGDGFTMDDGDCDDLDGSTYPGAADPSAVDAPLGAVTVPRGDTLVRTDRTVDYIQLPSYLEFYITDDAEQPVDGAVISIYSRYLYDIEMFGPATEVVTDMEGYASLEVNEFNDYAYKIHASIGDDPEENYVYLAAENTVAFETYTVERAMPHLLPPRPAATETTLSGAEGGGVQVAVEFSVGSHRIVGDGGHEGTFSWYREGGTIDAYIVDQQGYEAFVAGEPFAAVSAVEGAADGSLTETLPLTRAWYVVLSNAGRAGATMVGELSVTATATDGTKWPGQPLPVEGALRLPAGDHLAVKVEFGPAAR